MSENMPPADMIMWPKVVAAAVAATCAVAIRLTSADQARSIRTVLSDSIGSVALTVLLFALATGLGWNHWLAIGVSGVGAAAGWIGVYGLLRRAAEKRLGL